MLLGLPDLRREGDGMRDIPDDLQARAERAYRKATVQAVADQIMDGDDGPGPTPGEVTGLAAFWADVETDPEVPPGHVDFVHPDGRRERMRVEEMGDRSVYPITDCPPIICGEARLRAEIKPPERGSPVVIALAVLGLIVLLVVVAAMNIAYYRWLRG